MTARADYGLVFWMRFTMWCQARSYLLTIPAPEAVQEIRHEFRVSRPTAYRWLAAWREVSGATEGDPKWAA